MTGDRCHPMQRRFQHHYTVAQARELLPQVRSWLGEIRELKTRIDQRHGELLERAGEIAGKLIL